MKNKFKFTLMATLLLLMSLCLLGGCGLGTSKEDIINDNDLVAQVTYYSNGGAFEMGAATKEMWYKENSKVLNLGATPTISGSVGVSRVDYEFDKWYHVNLDGDGNPIYIDEEKKLLSIGEEVDFSVAIKSGEHWHIAAGWNTIVKIHVHLVTTDGSNITVGEGESAKTYENGGLIYSAGFGNSNSYYRPTLDPIEGNTDYTFIQYYHDQECTNPVEDNEWPLKPGEEDTVLYASHAPGKWTVISSAKDMSKFSMNIALSSAKIWIANDIDLQGKSMSVFGSIKAEIQGNGFKISNGIFTVNNLKPSNSTSIFGKISASAKIENLTFENMTFNVSVMPEANVNIYLFASDVESGATFTNVTFSGALNITLPSTTTIIDNIQFIEDSFEEDNFIVGGFNTDAEFTTAYPGITISNVTCNVVID